MFPTMHYILDQINGCDGKHIIMLDFWCLHVLSIWTGGWKGVQLSVFDSTNLSPPPYVMHPNCSTYLVKNTF